MDLTALVEDHDQKAASEGPVTYALLRAVRLLQDGRQFVEGDFREWVAEGERLRRPLTINIAATGDNITTHQDGLFLGQAVRPAAEHPERGPDRPLTTGDDDRPLPQPPSPGVPQSDRMAKARAARAAKAAARASA